MSDTIEIKQRISAVRPALDALRFFTATTRGFRDREQARLALFLKDIAEAELRDYSPDQVKEWLKTKAGWVDTSSFRRGDASGYLSLLRAIPPHLLQRTKDYAYLIAKGSGRRALGADTRDRIESEFAQNPQVAPPPNDDEDQTSAPSTNASAALR